MKIVTIVGARPQFIKAAAVSREFSKHNKIEEVIIHTGQHYDTNMSEIFFDEMQIPKPDYNLDINGLGHGAMTGQMLEKIEEVLIKEQPDHVLIYGDTNSTIAGALAASKLHISVVHVEAGLRSFNMEMPEEVNRILTDRISNILFCPTETAVNNLKREGYDNINCSIIENGDVMQDAALFYAKSSEEKSSVISANSLEKENFVLCTVHRAENTDNPNNLKAIFKALDEINRDKKVVLPLHPRTKAILQNTGIETEVMIIDPVGYFDMIELLKNCSFVMTDSGGLQKEAFFFKKQCITMRDQTEWIELIENGFNQITGADYDKIIDEVKGLENRNSNFDCNLYGNGIASQVIAETLLKA